MWCSIRGYCWHALTCRSPVLSNISAASLTTSFARFKEDGRRIKKEGYVEGTEGQANREIDYQLSDDVFVDESSMNRLYDGVPYSKLPVCTVRASKNNTFVILNDADGTLQMYRTCGSEGFKNARKRSSVAPNTVGTVLALRAVEQGYTNVRVCVRGLGPGRMEAVKGIVSGGLNVVSITDTTLVCWGFHRGRKVRRI